MTPPADPPADDPPVDDPPVQEPPVSDPPADAPTDPPALELVADTTSVSLLVDTETGQAYVQEDGGEPILISRSDEYWSGDVPLTRDGSTLQAAARDDLGRLRVLDVGEWGAFAWILDDSGRFIGEESQSDTSVQDKEDLFQLDIDGDGMIGQGEETMPPSTPDPGPALDVVEGSGSVSLLVDPQSGMAYVQDAGGEPITISRFDEYWSGDVPLTRDGSTLRAATRDGLGRLRVLDAGEWGAFAWILDEAGTFIGEEGPTETFSRSEGSPL